MTSDAVQGDAAAEPARGTVVRTPAADQPEPPDGLQRLWAPWRHGYVAGGEPVEGCPFCVLPGRGPDRDHDSLILHRGDRCYVIFNAYPYNPGHLMVVPFAHLAQLEDLDEPAAAELWRLGRRAVAVLRDRLRAEGVNLGMNLGRASGAGIAEHLHLHVVPRWVGDTNFVSVVGATRILPRALEEMYDELAGGFTGRVAPADAT
ncbi:MAG TPA: HIT domain-containing protein [Nitriliruptorales bacterium]|nr:HIT domain-containing protein [Nitriliruptorales bacterium]